MVDQTSSPFLRQAVGTGGHYKTGSLILRTAGSPYEALCLTDVVPIGYQSCGVSGASGAPTETVQLGYSKLAIKYGAGANCAGIPAPPVESSLVRVGLTGSGKVSFNGDGTAFTGGVKLGIGGAEILDGRRWCAGADPDRAPASAQMAVGQPARDARLDHRRAGAEQSDRPARSARRPGETQLRRAFADCDRTRRQRSPAAMPQSPAITECTTALPGRMVVTVNGTLSPPRGGAMVTLADTPVNGPLPLPAPVVDQVATTATGNFGEQFNRNEHSWNVVARIPAGDGYAAASSPACAIPIP
jgi:hypothetical protein